MSVKQTTLKRQLSKASPITIGIIVLFAAAMTYLIFQAFAASGTATLYTSPAGTQSVTNGQSFAVNVRVSSGASVPVTGASVYLSYPSDKLQVLSESYSGSPYTTQLIASDSGGLLRMDRAAFPMISGGDQLFAQVTFKAVATGSAAISFTGSSIVTSGEDDSNILSQRNGVTYNIAAPATPPPATPPASTPPASSGGSSSGSSSSSGTRSSGSTSTGGSSKSTPAQPGTASAPSADGSPSTPSDTSTGSSETSGSIADSTVQITILDSKNKPVEGAVVTVDGQTAKTDKNGVARFDSVAAGQQTLAVSYNGKKTTKVVQVKGASTAASPELFKVSIKRDKFNPAVLAIPVVVLLIAGVFFLRPWGMKFAKAPAAGQTDPDLIVTSNQPPVTPQTPTGRKLEAPGTIYAPGGPTSAAPGSTIAPAPPPTGNEVDETKK